jgi:methylmalonyl-CoA mutase cobalamin-binding subunit
MYSSAARDPVCADHLRAFGTRCISPGQFLSPKALARAAWVNLRHVLGATGAKAAPAPAE